jgi:hypothetical protein
MSMNLICTLDNLWWEIKLTALALHGMISIGSSDNSLPESGSFAECLALCREQFIGHSVKYTLSSATLSIERHSAKRVFAESQTFESRHKKALGKDVFVESLVLGKNALSTKSCQVPTVADVC